MFTLTRAELQNAYDAISHHGYSSLWPPPQEWTIVTKHWTQVRDHLSQTDLDVYNPYRPLRVVAPKSRANIRLAHLLHPEDLLIYTALVLIVKDDIEKARISRRARRVFSYRSVPAAPNRLYAMRGAYDNYLAQLETKTRKRHTRFVSTADIADFYPRINQHRLENIISSTATHQRGRDVARVLVKKLISKLMEANSYGIPVGPPASRVLGEAVLIDVDAHLQSKGVDYVRWVDDFHIFSRSEYMAQSTVFELAEWLFVHHGLTLQSSKTRIWPVAKYLNNVLVKPEAKLTDRDAVLAALAGSQYAADEPDNEEIQSALNVLQGFDLKDMLLSSISDDRTVDYQMVRYVLTRLPNIPGIEEHLKLEILDIVLNHAELLYPVVDYIARYVLSFTGLSPATKKKIGQKLLRPLTSRRNPPPPYYAMWTLYVLSTSAGWTSPSALVRLYSQSTSEIVRRYAALALSTCGTRAEALAIRDDLPAASSLLRTAILAASRKLGSDERKHWRLASPPRGIVEKYM